MEMREQLLRVFSWQALKKLDVEEGSQFPPVGRPWGSTALLQSDPSEMKGKCYVLLAPGGHQML